MGSHRAHRVVSFPRQEIVEAKLRGDNLYVIGLWDISLDRARIEAWGRDPDSVDLVRLALTAIANPRLRRRALEALRAAVSGDNADPDDGPIVQTLRSAD